MVARYSVYGGYSVWWLCMVANLLHLACYQTQHDKDCDLLETVIVSASGNRS